MKRNLLQASQTMHQRTETGTEKPRSSQLSIFNSLLTKCALWLIAGAFVFAPLTAQAEGNVTDRYVTFEFFDADGTTPKNATLTPVWTTAGTALQYSLDSINWVDAASGAAITSTNNKVLMRGSGRTGLFTGTASTNAWITTATKMKVSGNLNTLLDSVKPPTTLAANCYASMFEGCTSLATAPALPATILADECYGVMFYGCTSLATAPTLPATALADKCYVSMFSGCTSLVTAPALPATALADNCYANMFGGCTSLATAPALPVTTLTLACYQVMFRGCTSLVTAPALPATTLTDRCYESMFSGCTSLVTAPVLPATTLALTCYASMFFSCTSLVTAPALPATTLADACYNSMFSGCTSLATAPALPATTLADYCYLGMFRGCTSLVTAPALPATTLTDRCYRWMFSGCTSLNRIDVNFTSWTGSTDDWVSGVAATGTFTKPAGLDGTIFDVSHIPVGWTVVDDTPDGIEAVESAKVWSYGGQLYITAPQAGTAQVFSLKGQLVETLTYAAGETASATLAKGIYIVRIDEKTWKVIVN